jgi:hypothetical protein
VELEPLKYMTECTTRELALDDTVFDTHGDSELAVLGVEVGWRMLIVVYDDDDPEEAAEFRHLAILPRARLSRCAPNVF